MNELDNMATTLDVLPFSIQTLVGDNELLNKALLGEINSELKVAQFVRATKTMGAIKGKVTEKKDERSFLLKHGSETYKVEALTTPLAFVAWGYACDAISDQHGDDCTFGLPSKYQNWFARIAKSVEPKVKESASK